MSTNRNYYEILGLKFDATHSEIRKNYLQLQKVCHPDKVDKKLDDPTREKEIAEKTKMSQELTRAYETLGDPKKRANYDATLKSSKDAPVFESKDKASTFFHSSIPLFIQELAKDISLSADNVFKMYQANDGNYYLLANLRDYIKNFNNGLKPALSVKEALSTNPEVCRNLIFAYPFIINNRLSFEEAKKLTESERNILGENWNMQDEAIKALRRYRAERGLPSLQSEEVKSSLSIKPKT